MQHDHAEMLRDRKRNRKLIRMRSSLATSEEMSVILSDCTRYLNEIWYRAQEIDNHHDKTCQIQLSIIKIPGGGGHHTEVRKMSISPAQTTGNDWKMAFS